MDHRRPWAEADEYNILTGIMMTSPFFKKMSKAKEGSGPETYLRLPKGIIFTFGSRPTHALGAGQNPGQHGIRLDRGAP